MLQRMILDVHHCSLAVCDVPQFLTKLLLKLVRSANIISSDETATTPASSLISLAAARLVVTSSIPSFSSCEAFKGSLQPLSPGFATT